MNYLGEYKIDDYITFGVQLHKFASGAVFAPTGDVTYTFYENNNTGPTGGTLPQYGSKVGLYTTRIQLTSAAGFEVGKDYLIHIEATVDGVAAAELSMFRIVGNPKVDVDTIKGQAVTCSASVTVNPNIGTTQPVNFSSTGASALVKSDLIGILGTALTETAGYLAAGFKKFFNIATPVATVASVDQTGDSYGIVNHVTYGNAAIETEVAAIAANVSLIAPTTDASDSATLTYGTAISGTYVKTQTDDNDYYILAPVAVNGLDLTLDFAIGLGRAPVSIAINGYWNGSGRYCDVYVLDWILNVWDKLTNSTTRMNHRTSDANYTYPLNREHIDPDTGAVSVRFVSPSVTTTDRLRLDRVVVGTVDSSTGASASITSQDVWTYATRTLTSTGGEPVDTDAIATAVAAAILTNPAYPILTDSNGYVTSNVTGTVTVSGDVTLAASQPNYAPATVANFTTLNANILALGSPAQASDVPTDTEVATAVWDLANGIRTGTTPRQALRLVLTSQIGDVSGAETAQVTVFKEGTTAAAIIATVDQYGNRTVTSLDKT